MSHMKLPLFILKREKLPCWQIFVAYNIGSFMWHNLIIFSRSVVSNSLQPHGLQHARLGIPKTVKYQQCHMSFGLIIFCICFSNGGVQALKHALSQQALDLESEAGSPSLDPPAERQHQAASSLGGRQRHVSVA